MRMQIWRPMSVPWPSHGRHTPLTPDPDTFPVCVPFLWSSWLIGRTLSTSTSFLGLIHEDHMLQLFIGAGFARSTLIFASVSNEDMLWLDEGVTSRMHLRSRRPCLRMLMNPQTCSWVSKYRRKASSPAPQVGAACMTLQLPSCSSCFGDPPCLPTGRVLPQ